MSRVVEINSIEDLEPYRTAWHDLLRVTPLATFFQSLEWLEVYWRHFSTGQRLRVLVVESAGRPVGIVPLVVRKERTRLGRLRVLTFPLDSWGTFFGPIGPDPADTLAAALAHIRKTARDWDIVDLRAMDDERVGRGRVAPAFASAGLAAQRARWNQASIIDLAGNWDEYWSARDRHFRGNVRRGERKLRASGEVRTIRYRPLGTAHAADDPRWDLFDTCVRIAQRSWQGASTTGTTLSQTAVCESLRDAHAVAARAGALDVNVLLLDQRPAAFMYNYCYQGRVYGLRMGFDPQVSRVGAGNVLVRALVRDSFERGDKFIDLGPGYDAYKRHWRTATVASHRYSCFAPTAPRAQALRLKRALLNWWCELNRRQASAAQ
jgi:CelD/BcsL family acetyltransferase involved in cellulose biosynthesis